MNESTTNLHFETGGNTVSHQQGSYLEFLIREPKVVSPKRRALVLLHGVGSNEGSHQWMAWEV